MQNTKKSVTFEPQIVNSNFMTISNLDDIRSRNNIPEDAGIVSYYVGDATGANDNAVNSFQSDLNPDDQVVKIHIRCVSRVCIRTPQRMEMNTNALLDTGSILNFVSHSLIERLGNPKPLGTWTGSLKTVNGMKPLSTPFYEVILLDVYNTYHAIRALKIPSIGHSNALNYSDFLAMMQALHVNPSLV